MLMKSPRPNTATERTSNLTSLVKSDIQEGHPVRDTFDAFARATTSLAPQLAPSLDAFLPMLSKATHAHAILLEPVAAPCSVDFRILFRGARFPGAAHDPLGPDDLYSHGLAADGVPDRLLELASCLALKQAGLSKANSARFGHVDVLMYRGVFPLWSQDLLKSVVLLVAAPGYVSSAEA